jgi:hypothetical protein
VKSHLAGDPIITKLLSVDPIAEAEKLTGKSCKNNGNTMELGMYLQLAHSDEKKTALHFADDTTMSNDLERYLRIVYEEGFEKLLEVPFVNHYYPDIEEKLFVFWHTDGILLSFDTYRSTQVNGGNFHYNWKPFPGWFSAGQPRVTWSGGWNVPNKDGAPKFPDYREMHPYPEDFQKLTTDPEVLARQKAAEDYWQANCVWEGKHDCREGFRHHLALLRKWGTFVKPWGGDTLLWLLHHGDTKIEGYNVDAINQQRIKMFPKVVQEAIGQVKLRNLIKHKVVPKG